MAAPAIVSDIQYVTDAEGNPVSVIVPIGVWQEIASERETDYLLQSEAMRQRLRDAANRKEGVPLEDVRARLGV